VVDVSRRLSCTHSLSHTPVGPTHPSLAHMPGGVLRFSQVMLDGMNGDKENEKAASPILPALAMVGIIVARTFDVLPLSDHLTRAFLFIPLFCVFLMRIHRETVYKVQTYVARQPISPPPSWAHAWGFAVREASLVSWFVIYYTPQASRRGRVALTAVASVSSISTRDFAEKAWKGSAIRRQWQKHQSAMGAITCG
jgi:hypothetical protein